MEKYKHFRHFHALWEGEKSGASQRKKTAAPESVCLFLFRSYSMVCPFVSRTKNSTFSAAARYTQDRSRNAVLKPFS